MAFVAKDFWSILIIWSLLGVTTTFESGASSSWVVDNLKKKKKPNLQQEYFIKLQSIFLLGAIIAPLIGSVIIRYFSYTGLWLVFGCGMILTGILLSNIPEYYKPKKVSVKKTILNNFKLAKKGFAFVKKTKEIYYFIIAGFFVMLIGLGDTAWEPFMVELGAPVHYLGYVYSLVALAVIGVPFLVRRFTHIKVKYILMITEIIDAIVLLSVLLLKPGFFWYVLIPYIIFAGTDRFTRPIKENFLHKHIKDNIRATVISIRSMFHMLSASIVVLISGPLLDFFPLKWIIAGGSIFVIGVVYFYNKIE